MNTQATAQSYAVDYRDHTGGFVKEDVVTLTPDGSQLFSQYDDPKLPFGFNGSAQIRNTGGGAMLVNGNAGQGAIQALTSAPFLDHDVVQKSLADGIDASASLVKITNSQILTSGTAAGTGILPTTTRYGTDVLIVTGNVISRTKGPGINVSSTSSTSSATATISGNTVTANQGAGVEVGSVSLTTLVSDNTVSGNTGSGIDIAGNCGSTTTVAGNLVSGNTGSSGGIVFNAECDAAGSITGNTISSNVATGNGGGIYLSNSSSTVSVDGNTVSSNTATNGGGIYFDGSSPETLSGNFITNNTATATDDGGGIYICPTCAPAFSNNDIYGNKSGSSVANDVYDGIPAPNTLAASNDFWGTTNMSAIYRHIYDNHVNNSLGVFNFQPILTTTISLPDLVVVSASNPPATVQPGGAIGIADVVANAGGGSASASTTEVTVS